MTGLSSRLIALLGYGGAIPFLGLGGLLLGGGQSAPVWPAGWADPSFMLLGYAAIILSFLGGLHWGRLAHAGHQVKAGDNLCLAFSVLPALTGWLVLIWPLPVQTGGTLLLAGFGVCWWLDRQLVRAGAWAVFMARLRSHLTLSALFAMACLVAAG